MSKNHWAIRWHCRQQQLYRSISRYENKHESHVSKANQKLIPQLCERNEEDQKNIVEDSIDKKYW